MDDAPTRRAVLLSAAGIVIGAGAGAAYAAFRPEPSGGRAAAPPELAAAAGAESALIAIIDAELAAHGNLSPLAAIRTDHQAHLAALRQALATYPGPAAASPPSGAPQPSATTAAALTRVRHAEQRAATAAAQRARALSGATATVLASISACEATHAALFA